MFPVAGLQPGMKATGLTVVKGRTPVSFDVEILGVLKDGIAPGLDFILVQASGPVIDQTGGIAAGFSGSPVYIGGQLVGAIAYGFFGADQTIGGVTPAEGMVQIFDYPETGASSPALARTVAVTPELRRAAAAATGENIASLPTAAEQLRVPLGVSGLSGRALDEFQRIVDEELHLPYALYRAGQAATPTSTASAPLKPGESFAAALSFGDLTAAGIGTTTAVCGNLALAFGHPFFFQGPTMMGMNGADVLTVVPDPSQVFGPFKIAEVAELHGIVDRDHLAGIRGIEGLIPAVIPVTTSIENPDLPKSRDGQTDVVTEEFLPFLSAFHLLLNLDVTFDRIGDGTVGLDWMVTGTRASGATFELSRSNMYFSEFDASIESIFELLFQLEALANNDFEEIHFTGVDVDGFITEQELTARITKVKSASTLQPGLKVRELLQAKPGTLIRLRVFLKPAEGGAAVPVDMSLRVPKTAKGSGPLTVRGGGQEFFFFFKADGAPGSAGKAAPANGGGGGGPESFDDLLAQMEGAEHQFDLIATLFPNRGKLQRRKAVSPQEVIVFGERSFDVLVVRK